MTAQPRCCRWREEERHCREALPRGETAASGPRLGPCAACREAPGPAHAARADVTPPLAPARAPANLQTRPAHSSLIRPVHWVRSVWFRWRFDSPDSEVNRQRKSEEAAIQSVERERTQPAESATVREPRSSLTIGNAVANATMLSPSGVDGIPPPRVLEARWIS